MDGHGAGIANAEPADDVNPKNKLFSEYNGYHHDDHLTAPHGRRQPVEWTLIYIDFVILIFSNKMVGFWKCEL